MRLTMKLTLRSSAISQPLGKTGSAIRGRSGYRKTDMVSAFTPVATMSRNASLDGVDRLVNQQPGTVQRGDDRKGDDPGPANGKGHGKA